MRIFGYILALALVAIGMGDVTTFIDGPSLALVVGFVLWGFLGSAGAATGTALGAVFSGSTTDEKSLLTGLHALKTSRQAAIAGGFLAVVAGFVLMLKNMDDPASIGPGMAMALLGLFYALFFAYILLLPLQAGVERRMIPARGTDAAPAETPLDLMVLGGGFLVTLITFSVLVISIKFHG